MIVLNFLAKVTLVLLLLIASLLFLALLPIFLVVGGIVIYFYGLAEMWKQGFRRLNKEVSKEKFIEPEKAH